MVGYLINRFKLKKLTRSSIFDQSKPHLLASSLVGGDLTFQKFVNFTEEEALLVFLFADG
jgi:hypothetical protein